LASNKKFTTLSITREKKGHNSWTVNVNFTIIEFNLYFMVHRIVLKFEKIWLSRTLNIIRKPRKSLSSKKKKGHNSWTVNVNFTIIELNLYFMVHRIVLKFEKIWKSFQTLTPYVYQLWSSWRHYTNCYTSWLFSAFLHCKCVSIICDLS
jgi:hypothetical protein